MVFDYIMSGVGQVQVSEAGSGKKYKKKEAGNSTKNELKDTHFWLFIAAAVAALTLLLFLACKLCCQVCLAL